MIDTTHIIGKWKNSKAVTDGIEQFTFSNSDIGLTITIEGAKTGLIPGTFGPLAVNVYSTDPSSKVFSAFEASITSAGTTYFFAGNINKGLIIIATYVNIGESRMSNFFIREFFYKLK